MADQDPWEKPAARDPWEKPEASPPPESNWQFAGEEALGAVRGVAKGFGNLAEALPTLGTPHVSELDPNAKKFLESPNATVGESVGQFAAETIPFVVGGPEVGLIKGIAPRIAPYLGRALGDALSTLAAHALVGGASAAAQPTKEGESRLVNAATGAATAGVLSPAIAGKASKVLGVGLGGQTAEEVGRQFGVPAWMILPMLGAWSWHGLMHNSGLGRLADHDGQAGRRREGREWLPVDLLGPNGPELVLAWLVAAHIR